MHDSIKYILNVKDSYNFNYSNQESISQSKNLTEDATSGIFLDNSISVFKFISNILLLIYAN